MTGRQILSPDCPECGHPPLMTEILPYFCGNDACQLLSWNPELTLGDLRVAEVHRIDLTVLEPPGSAP